MELLVGVCDEGGRACGWLIHSGERPAAGAEPRADPGRHGDAGVERDERAVVRHDGQPGRRDQPQGQGGEEGVPHHAGGGQATGESVSRAGTGRQLDGHTHPPTTDAYHRSCLAASCGHWLAAGEDRVRPAQQQAGALRGHLHPRGGGQGTNDGSPSYTSTQQ